MSYFNYDQDLTIIEMYHEIINNSKNTELIKKIHEVGIKEGLLKIPHLEAMKDEIYEVINNQGLQTNATDRDIQELAYQIMSEKDTSEHDDYVIETTIEYLDKLNGAKIEKNEL